MRFGALLCGLALGLLASACGEDAPVPNTGSYRLGTVNGLGLPALRWATIECDIWITNGALSLGTADAHLEITEGTDCLRNGTPATVGIRSYSGTWVSENEGFRFTASADGVAGDSIEITGTIESDRVLVLVDPTFHAVGEGQLRFNWTPLVLP